MRLSGRINEDYKVKMEKDKSKKSSKSSSGSISAAQAPPQRTDLAGLDKIVEAECTQTFSRTFGRLPIHKDLGRLISKIKLIGFDGNELFVGQAAADEPLGAGVKRFLKVLVELYDPAIVRKQYYCFINPRNSI